MNSGVGSLNSLWLPLHLHAGTAASEIRKVYSACIRLNCVQNVVRRKHHVPVHGMPSSAIIGLDYV